MQRSSHSRRKPESKPTGKTHPRYSRAVPGSHNVRGNLTLKALTGRRIFITQVRSMMERPDGNPISLGAIDRRTDGLCLDGNSSEWQCGCLSHDLSGCLQTQGDTTSAFDWQSSESRSNRGYAKQCNRG